MGGNGCKLLCGMFQLVGSDEDCNSMKGRGLAG